MMSYDVPCSYLLPGFAMVRGCFYEDPAGTHPMESQ
jgi:hypothetical protein